jgi:hypothetical protein
MKPRQLALALLAEDDPRIAAPPAPADAALCTECQQRPRAAHGRLSRCLDCVRAAAERDREARAQVHARAAQQNGTAPKAKTSPPRTRTKAPAEAKAPTAPAKKPRKATSRKPRKPGPAEPTAKPAATLATLTAANDVGPVNAGVKCCRSCKQSQPLEAFTKHRLSRDGHRHDCKSCVLEGRTKPPREISPEQAAKDKQQRAKPHRRKANRIAVRNWTKRNEHAYQARKALQRAVRKGIVTPAEECEAEGCNRRTDLEAHHADYDQPLEAAWLCARHHRRLHNGGRIKLKPPRPQRLAGIPKNLK